MLFASLGDSFASFAFLLFCCLSPPLASFSTHPDRRACWCSIGGNSCCLLGVCGWCRWPGRCRSRGLRRCCRGHCADAPRSPARGHLDAAGMGKDAQDLQACRLVNPSWLVAGAPGRWQGMVASGDVNNLFPSTLLPMHACTSHLFPNYSLDTNGNERYSLCIVAESHAFVQLYINCFSV